MAPNVMTFAGFLLTALNFVMLSYYDWDFFASTDDEKHKPIPNWFWIFASANIFLAYTLGEIVEVFLLSSLSSSQFPNHFKTESMESRQDELDFPDH